MLCPALSSAREVPLLLFDLPVGCVDSSRGLKGPGVALPVVLTLRARALHLPQDRRVSFLALPSAPENARASLIRDVPPDAHEDDRVVTRTPLEKAAESARGSFRGQM